MDEKMPLKPGTNQVKVSRILKLDKSCISNPKFPNLRLDGLIRNFEMSDLRCRLCPISNFPSTSPVVYSLHTVSKGASMNRALRFGLAAVLVLAAIPL